jgi:hypothetical protein
MYMQSSNRRRHVREKINVHFHSAENPNNSCPALRL